jgi:hypothetical protein
LAHRAVKRHVRDGDAGTGIAEEAKKKAAIAGAEFCQFAGSARDHPELVDDVRCGNLSYNRLHFVKFGAGYRISSVSLGRAGPCEMLDAPQPMTIETNLEKTVFIGLGIDELQPFIRAAGDGTFEVEVPLADHLPPLVLPYSFHSEEDATLWLKSRKGNERIAKARASFGIE